MDTIETVGYGAFFPTTRANEVDILFELAIKHKLAYDPTMLYHNLIDIIYGKSLECPITHQDE